MPLPIHSTLLPDSNTGPLVVSTVSVTVLTGSVMIAPLLSRRTTVIDPLVPTETEDATARLLEARETVVWKVTVRLGEIASPFT